MKHQAYHMAMLFDFYGDLLTDRQKEFFDLYYNEDYSLAEIAEHSGITRQGVRDAIVRAEKFLTEIEEKTGIIQRFMQLRPHVETIEEAAREILLVNRRTHEDAGIAALAEQILETAALIKE